jgi:hypothetical protein
MKNKKIILGSILGVVIISLFIALFLIDKTKYKQTVSSDDPTDIALDFYHEWLDASQSTSTTPYQEGLAKAPILSKTLSDRLVTTPENQELDPVLCQNILPTKVSSRTIFEDASSTQILVLSKEPKQAGQAIFVLSRLTDGWYIDDIICSQGESDTPREFSFEHEGGMFNDISDQPQHDQNNWTLLYTQDTQMYTAPLFFTANSVCIDLTGSESVCNPDTFKEAKVMVQGEMLENGVEVKRLKHI